MIARLIRLVRAPGAELGVIAQEKPTTRALLLQVATPLAVLATTAPTLGRQIFGESALGIVYRPPILESLLGIVTGTALIVGALYLVGLVISRTAPLFDGKTNPTRALQASVYGASPALLAAAPLIVPALWPLAFAGLWSLIVLHRALPILMHVPPNRATAMTTMIVVVGLVLLIVLASLSACVGQLL